MELTRTPQHPHPAQPKAVNDVSAPAAAPASNPASAPDKDAPLTVHEPAADAENSPQPKDAAPKQAKQKPGKVMKSKRQGAGLAIFAAVVIILGLGALMTYAYLRTNNIAVF